jgi:hypothetical protein
VREATWQQTVTLWVLERQRQAHMARISQTRPIRELIQTLMVRELLEIQVESATRLPRELDMALQLEQGRRTLEIRVTVE